MTTRIILHGGNSNKKSDKNDQFFRAIINGIDKETMQVLCVYFARPEGRWEDSYSEDQSIFRALGTEMGLDIDTKLASYDMDELLENIVGSDIIFINGGFKGHLKEVLLYIGIDNFRQLIQGKTLVGISAGANILSKYYYSQDIDNIREGIGLLDIKLLTHFTAQKPEQKEMLKLYKENLPILTVGEEEYIVIH